MRTALAFALLSALLPILPMQAQELDIYDINDFVDPRDLGKDSFLVSRIIVGGVTRYLDVFRPTNSDVAFGHLATSYYRGSWQANWKHTRITTNNFPDVFDRNSSEVEPNGAFPGPGRGFAFSPTPENKNTLQLARYFAVGRAASPSIIRIEATWTSVEYRHLLPNPGEQSSDFHSRFENEVGFEGDIPWRVGRFPVVTSLVYVGRFKTSHTTAADPPTRRATLLQRAPRISLGRWSIDTAVALGSVHADSRWHDLLIQPSLHVTSPTIPGVDVRVHFKYAPAIGELGPPPPGETKQSRTVNQISVFMERTVFAKRIHSRAR